MTPTHVRRCGAWLLAVVLPACAGERSEAELTPAMRVGPPLAPPRAKLTTYSGLGELLGQGKTGPAVWLRKLGEDPSLVGIGSLSALRGEVAIVDGRVWLGYSTDASSSQGRALDGSDETAASLVVASVPEWKTFTLATSVLHTSLDRRLEKLARDAGLDVAQPIPVVITGRLQNLRFHVADGRGLPAGQPISEKDLLAQASKIAIEDADGVLVGFFSSAPHPAILHSGSHLHLHVVLPQKPEVGHVDHVDLDVGTVVRLPVPAR